MIPTRDWYNLIAESYKSLYKEEQENKLKEILNILSKLFPNKIFNRGLDIGCGPGYSTKYLKKIAKEIYAIDISDKLLEIAKKDIELFDVNFIKADAKDLPFKDEFFDIVFSITVLQDDEDPEKIIKEIYRVLKKEGIVVLSILNRTKIEFWKKILKKYFKIVWFEEICNKDFLFILKK